MNKFESVRIYKDEFKTHSMYQTKNRIEFVVNKSKLQQFLTHVFGNLYNVGSSRYGDGLMVYRPQDYRDFLALLNEVKLIDGNISAYLMEFGCQTILSNNHTTFYDPIKIKRGAEKLIEFASKYLVDSSLTYAEQEKEQKEFVNKCNQILQGLGVSCSQTI